VYRLFYSRSFPRRGGGLVKFYPEPVAGLVIEAVAMERVAFHATADATSEALEHLLVLMLHTAADVHHVAGAAILRVYGGENVVEQSALVEFGVFDVRAEREKLPGHLEDIIHVAGLSGAAIHSIAEFVRLAEMFIIAMAAGGIAVMLGDAVPEKAGG